MKDYYDILGIQKGASKDEVKKAFRKLAEVMPALDGKELQAAINNGTITEVMCHE